MKRRLSALLLSAALAFSALPAAGAYDQPSEWSRDAVSWLQSTGQLSAEDFTDYGRTVTRSDFARLSVKLYYLLTECPPPYVTAGDNPFLDTDETAVIQAYKLGLVGGLEGGALFGPDLPVTREQIAVMLLRVLDACPNVSYSTADVSHILFSDEAQLSDWAAQGVKRAYLIRIMNGTGGTSISPLSPVTREQAYQLLYNIYQNRYVLSAGRTRPVSTGPLGTLALRYSDGGRDAVTSQIAYHAKPVVCDLDGDGKLDIVAAASSVMCLDAATGKEKWKSAGDSRVWADPFVGDIDGDGANEVVTGHADGSLRAYDKAGNMKPGWPVGLPGEIYSVEAADLDGDGTLEIAAGVGVGDGTNVWVYEHDGTLRPGWPQLDAARDGAKASAKLTDRSYSYAWGVFNDNIAIGDIDDDGRPEIVVPSDVPQICAYEADGTPVKTASDFDGGVPWGRVGAFSDAAYEAQVPNGGFGMEADRMGNPLNLLSLPMNERQIATFTHSKAAIADLDGDGKNEVAVVGAIHDRAVGPLPSLYQELYLFRGDRTRYSGWTSAPAKVEAPLSEDWNLIERCVPDPVCADLDGDGSMEILYPDFAGKLNCFWLDHTQHGSWPINVWDGTNLEYAAPPAVYDLDGDEKQEVIYVTHPTKHGAKSGRLYIADSMGRVLQSVDLPLPTNIYGGDYNAGCVPPVVADVDGDDHVEIIVHTYLSGVVVYDLI